MPPTLPITGRVTSFDVESDRLLQLTTDETALKGRVNESEKCSAEKWEIDRSTSLIRVGHERKPHRVTKVTLGDRIRVGLGSRASEINLTHPVPVPENRLPR